MVKQLNKSEYINYVKVRVQVCESIENKSNNLGLLVLILQPSK